MGAVIPSITVVIMRLCVSFAFFVFAILTVPGLLSAASTTLVWVGVVTAVVSIIIATIVASTPVLDAFFGKIIAAYLKGTHHG